MKALLNKFYYILIILLFGTLSSVFAQLGLGTDVVSRYVWRGTDFGDSPSIQPTINYTTSGFSVGFWGAYQLSRNERNGNFRNG